MQSRAPGKPPKFSVCDRFRVKESAPADFRERVGTIVAQAPGKAEYMVKFDDGPNSVTYLQSNWMEPLEQSKRVTAA